MNILALDLATNTGWAFGILGSVQPTFGSVRFGQAESSRTARFANCLEWTSAFLKRQDETGLVVFEAPLHFGLRRGNSNAGNDELAYGLAAIVRAVARLRGVHDVREARTIDVRRFFLGVNPKRKDAKRQTIECCHALGLEVEDDNQADAVATWFYQCAQLQPQFGLQVSPLFRKPIAL
jgi:hypothetical protein